jgi:poly-gamma-glutamate synthesis protein (capsule biosynthesis protein)
MLRKVLMLAALAVFVAGTVAVMSGGDPGGADDVDFDGFPHGVDDGSRFVMVAGGDINVGRSIGRAIKKKGFDWVFGAVKPYFEGADLTFGNLEMVFTNQLAAKRDKSKHKRAWNIHARPDQVQTLHKIGVDLVTTANNHAFDYTCPGIKDTRKTLTEAGILFTGTGETTAQANKPAITTVNGVRIGIISFCSPCASARGKKDHCGVRQLSASDKRFDKTIAALSQQIYSLRREVDVVFVSPHWGRPFQVGKLDASMVRLGRAIIEAGAHGILGHGNHVLLGVETWKGRPILYDMGNFLFDQAKYKAYRQQFFYRLEITKEGVQSVELLPFELTERRQSILLKGEALKRLIDRQEGRTNMLGSHLVRRQDGRVFMDLTRSSTLPPSTTTPAPAPPPIQPAAPAPAAPALAPAAPVALPVPATTP